MKKTTYTPIDCGLHSEYEIAVMHNKVINVDWLSEDIKLMTSGIATDVITRDKAEYLVLRTENNGMVKIRLDKITRFSVNSKNA